jgi:CRISPR-associated endoribonuclease Cas6
MTFTVKGVRLFDLALPEDDFREFTLTSGTPIIVRIPRYRYEEYGIEPKKNYEYAYWREEYPLSAFIRQLGENLNRKFADYTGESCGSVQLIPDMGLELRRQVAVPLTTQARTTTLIGTLWSFRFSRAFGFARRVIGFGLDSGFGEMNSLGFGFMNLMQRQKHAS